LAAGCATGPGGAGEIDALHVFSLPVALDLDGRPGPDGFGLTVYASNAGGAKGIPIKDGRVEILMFDGALAADAITNAQPRRVWTFTPTELKKQAIHTSLGTGYRFTLPWLDRPPTQSRITILARIASARRPPVQSAATIVAVPPK